MKRFLHILLVLILGLGPSLAAIPASAFAFGWGANQDESGVPACCRRNGAHHCMMNQAQKRAMQSGNEETSVSAVNGCPCFPRSLATSVTSDHALAGKAAGQATLVVERRTALASEVAAKVSARRTWPKRGPPASLLL